MRIAIRILFVSFVPFGTLAMAAADQGDEKPTTDLVFIGTYTGPNSKGIYRAEFDPSSGKLSKPVLAATTDNPSFLAIHPSGKSLYCVNEIDKFEGKKSGAITAFSLDPKSGELKQLNRKPSGGPAPCHINVHPRGNFLAVANYGGGGGPDSKELTANVIVVSIAADGSFFRDGDQAKWAGKSVHARQQASHTHSVNFTPDGEFFLVADLGVDEIKFYNVEYLMCRQIKQNLKLAAGSGPRHLDINRKSDRAYVVNELNSTVSVFELDKGKELQTISTLPKGADAGKNGPAEIRIHHHLGYVYASNRGHDSIAIFKINPADGTLSVVGHAQHPQLKNPRGFTLHKDFLLAAGQSSNKIVVFRIDSKTGELHPTEQVIDVSAPVCLRVLERVK